MAGQSSSRHLTLSVLKCRTLVSTAVPETTAVAAVADVFVVEPVDGSGSCGRMDSSFRLLPPLTIKVWPLLLPVPLVLLQLFFVLSES